jgi:hypothetical protein
VLGGRCSVGHLLGGLEEGNDTGQVVDREGLGRDALLGVLLVPYPCRLAALVE